MMSFRSLGCVSLRCVSASFHRKSFDGFNWMMSFWHRMMDRFDRHRVMVSCLCYWMMMGFLKQQMQRWWSLHISQISFVFLQRNGRSDRKNGNEQLYTQFSELQLFNDTKRENLRWILPGWFSSWRETVERRTKSGEEEVVEERLL